MNRPIVVPLDSSVFAGGSLSLARAVARQSGAAVHLVRVDPARAVDFRVPAAGRRRESWESDLDGVGRYFFSELGAHRVRTELVEGERVVDALAAYARTRNAWMVVVAANGVRADGYSRGIETAARLGRESGVPVLLVHPETDVAAHAAGSVDRLVVALSGSEVDDELMEAARRVGGAGRTHCTLLHVIRPARADGETLTDRIASATCYLEHHAGALRERGHEVEVRVSATGDAARAIAETVRGAGAKLLVLGAQRRGTPRVGLGSTTTALFLTLDLPMLVVSPTERCEGPRALAG